MFLQSNSGHFQQGSGDPLRDLFVTLPLASQIGDVVLVSFGVTQALNATPFTIGDNLGNIYSQVAFVSGTGFGNTSGGVYQTTVTVPGTITVQLHLGDSFQAVQMALDSYKGPLTFDQTSSSASGNSGPITTTNANELLYAVGIGQGLGPCISSFVAPTGGWMTREADILVPLNDVGVGLAVWDRTVSAIGTFAADPGIISPSSGPGSGGVSAFLVFIVSFVQPVPPPPSGSSQIFLM